MLRDRHHDGRGFIRNARTALTGPHARGVLFSAAFVRATGEDLGTAEERFDLGLDALLAEHGPKGSSGTRVIAQHLVEQLDPSGALLATRVDVAVRVLERGEAAVVGALGPKLVEVAPADRLADVLAPTLRTGTKKALRAVLASAATRSLPADADREALLGAFAPVLGESDDALVREAVAVLEGWGIERSVGAAGVSASASAGARAAAPTGDEEPAASQAHDRSQARWRRTPPRWTVPRLEPVPSGFDAMIAAAEESTRPVAGHALDPILGDRALEAIAAFAFGHPEWSAEFRRAFPAGRFVPHRSGSVEMAEGRATVFTTLTGLGRGANEDPRAAELAARLGEVPGLLSLPSRIDQVVEPEDLVARLGHAAELGVTVLESDVLLAALLVDPDDVTAEHLAALGALDVPVSWADAANTETAGPFLARALADPVREPAFEFDSRKRTHRPGDPTIPDWLAARPELATRNPSLPHHKRFRHPHWGDAIGRVLGPERDHYGTRGVQALEIVTRASPLAPATAANLLAAQASADERNAGDLHDALLLAWDRGLLVPGGPDASRVDWAGRPGGLVALSEVCRGAADDGLLSVAWSFLDDLAGVAAAADRLPPGVAEVVAELDRHLPDAIAAVASGIAPETVLDLSGVRAVADRGGSSRAVKAALALLARVSATRSA